MKSCKLIITMLCCLYCSFMNAQTTYKGVTIDRSHQDNRVIVVKNANNYPVNIKMQYKIGSRETDWIDFSHSYTRIEANATKEYSVGSKIYGLNLIYVDILQEGARVGEFFKVLLTGNSEGKQNGNSTTSNSSSETNTESSSSGLRCYKCNGSGTIDGQTCPECNGSGKQTKPVPFPEPEKRY